MVHRRTVGDTEIVLGNQGALWGNAMTWWDHDTGSIWSQPLGEAIAGPRKGARLELVASTLTTWASWRAEHPDGLALDAPSGQSGFDLARMAVVVDFGDETAAYEIPALRRSGPANDVVAGVPIAVLTDPSDPELWNVFSRTLDDTIVTLVARDGTIMDEETGSTWDPLIGIALSGPLEGEVLDRLPGFTSFPRDYFTFWPEGRIWSGD